ncbi:methyl-accepting chemotaxis protein [Terrilactibacillus laevilacticus]|uniref:Methyl-accepting chemotaxis protein n=1 Tax=Terrilactibacillus laevilacticus TaxID=1380157 RepID=A0ABW5PTB0_9BACI|nr:methyl-accepting chemotaxis protein [Terrilactibacillus laevilacticus]
MTKFKLSSMSLRTLQIMLIVLIVIIPDSIIFSYIYKTVTNSMQKQLNNSATNSVHLLNNNITEFISGEEHVLNNISKHLSGDFEQKQAMQTLLDYIHETDNSSNAFTLGNVKGQYVRSPNVKVTNDVRQELWYREAMAHPGKVIITPPFVSTLTKQITVIIAKTTPDNKAVISMDVKISSLEQLTKQVTVGNSGYAFLLDEEMKWIANPKSKVGSKAAELLRNKLAHSSNGTFTDTRYQSNDEIFFTTNSLTGWKIGGVMSAKDINTIVHPLILKLSVIAMITLVIIIILAWLFIFYKIIRPLDIFVNIFSKIGSGDLTRSLGKEVAANKEFTKMSHSVNKMIDSLKVLFASIREKSELLAASSEELTASTEENKATSDEIAHSIQEVASGAEEQSKRVDDSMKNADAIQAALTHIENRIDHLNDTSEKSMSTVNNGLNAVTLTTQQMNSIKSIVEDLSSIVDNLSHRSGEIGKIINVINDIAEQTHLLSLNAAIEAARAGEEGKGFAVVAEEIRKLADQSSQSTKQVHNTITLIQNETNLVVESMNRSVEEVEKGIRVVDKTGHAFNSINTFSKTVEEQIQAVIEAINTISEATTQSINSFNPIAKLADNTSAYSQSVSAATEEQLASMEEVASNAESLSKMADELQASISKFKIN